ncbi:MAG: hypothetical protein CM1200mP10_16830 [Candidatus Neomarinimicrobiota bacterium]|nr:MAG: hypothetical protein CM1200mP10_16830 [Candidatus Neomarinimicrobiota bacterium]
MPIQLLLATLLNTFTYWIVSAFMRNLQFRIKKVLHFAAVAAELLDNDEDGRWMILY